MRDDYHDGLIAGFVVAFSFAGLILLIASILVNTEKNTATQSFMNGPRHTVKKLKTI